MGLPFTGVEIQSYQTILDSLRKEAICAREAGTDVRIDVQPLSHHGLVQFISQAGPYRTGCSLEEIKRHRLPDNSFETSPSVEKLLNKNWLEDDFPAVAVQAIVCTTCFGHFFLGRTTKRGQPILEICITQLAKKRS